jgi:hypothetical protein
MSFAMFGLVILAMRSGSLGASPAVMRSRTTPTARLLATMSTRPADAQLYDDDDDDDDDVYDDVDYDTFMNMTRREQNQYDKRKAKAMQQHDAAATTSSSLSSSSSSSSSSSLCCNRCEVSVAIVRCEVTKNLFCRDCWQLMSATSSSSSSS